MKLNIKREINILLRRFVLENPMKNKEIAINYILKNFLLEFYRIDKEEKKWLIGLLLLWLLLEFYLF